MVTIIKNIYGWFGGLWECTLNLFWNQTLDFGSLKVLIHIPIHLMISFLSAFFTLLIFNNFIYAFYAGCGAGIVIELALFFWLDFWNDKFTGIIQSLFDIVTYCVGAAFIFLLAF